jgi:hypothetical protein
VHVDGAVTAQIVEAPHLAQQPFPGEDVVRVQGQEPQQLELLERQIEPAPAHRGAEGQRIDVQPARVDRRVGRVHRHPPGRHPQPRLQLGRPGAGQHHVVQAPVGGDRRQPGLGDHHDQRHAQRGRAQPPAGLPRAQRVQPGVHQHGVRVRRRVQSRPGPDRVVEQIERGQQLTRAARGSGGQQQNLHSPQPPPELLQM